MHQPIFAFDFSMAKPAMVSLINNKLEIYIWPMDLDEKSEKMISACNVNIWNRHLPSMHKKYNEHTLILEHVERAENLAELITETIDSKLSENGIMDKSDIIIANEGFSFSSRGNATLDLSGYKYILMHTLKEHGYENFKTYSSITIKSTAGCAKKGMGKIDMINRTAEEDQDLHLFIHTLAIHSELLKKKTAFIDCIDDICDAYWCLRTTINKENINCCLSE